MDAMEVDSSPEYDPSAPVDNETIVKVVEHPGIVQNPMRLGLNLGVSNAKLMNIVDRYDLSLEKKCEKTLESWVHEKGLKNATKGVLLTVLQNLGYDDIAEKFGKPKSFENGDVSSLFNLEASPGEHFIGRREEIETVLENMKITRMFGIFAFSGIGKSHFARYMAYRIAKQCQLPVRSYVADLRGVTSPSDLKMRFFSMMGIDANATSYAYEINARIKDAHGFMHVFIVDNAEDVNEIAELKDEFLQKCGTMMADVTNAVMFITSKVEFRKTEPAMKNIDLPPLSAQEAEALLKITAPDVNFGDWTEDLVELCGGNPQIIKMAGCTILEDKTLDIGAFVKSAKEDLLRTFDDPTVATYSRTEGMVNLFLARLTPAQKKSLQELHFMQNTFSKLAAAAILDKTTVSAAFLDALRSLRNRHVLDAKTQHGQVRLYIHGLVRDWLRRTGGLSDEELQGVRKRFIAFFAEVMESISRNMQSIDADKAIGALGLEILNLKKLLQDSTGTVDGEETYNLLKKVAFCNRELIEKYMSDVALPFYESMHAVSTLKSDHSAVGIMASRIGSHYTNVTGKSAEGLAWFERATADIDKGGPSDQVAMLYQHKGWNYHLQGQKESAIECLEKARQMIEGLGKSESRLAMMNFASLGVVYTFHGDLDKGKDFHKKSISLCLSIMGPQYSLGSYYNNLGINYRLRGDLENALKYTQLGLEIKQKYVVGPERSVVLSLNNLAMLYASARNDTDRALAMLDQADKMRSKLPPSALVEALTMDNYCQVHIKRGTFEQGIPFGQKAVEVNRQHKPRHVMFAESLINCATALYGSGRQAEAYSLLQEALAIKDDVLKQMPKQYYVFETYRMLAKVAKADGQENEARKYFMEGNAELERLRTLHAEEGNENDLKMISEKFEGFSNEMQ